MLQKVSYCSLPKRLAIVIYDAVVITAILFVATLLWLPLNAGEAITADSVLVWPYRLSLLLAVWFYLALSWRLAGQTLGMRAWRISIVSVNREAVNWLQCALRFLTGGMGLAAFGFGFWSCLLRKDRAAWHDLASGTRLVVKQPLSS